MAPLDESGGAARLAVDHQFDHHGRGLLGCALESLPSVDGKPDALHEVAVARGLLGVNAGGIELVDPRGGVVPAHLGRR